MALEGEQSLGSLQRVRPALARRLAATGGDALLLELQRVRKARIGLPVDRNGRLHVAPQGFRIDRRFGVWALRLTERVEVAQIAAISRIAHREEAAVALAHANCL